MSNEGATAVAIWKVQVHDELGQLLHEEEKHNLIVDVGRRDGLQDLFTTIPSALFQQMAVGMVNQNGTANAVDLGLGVEITNASSPAGSLSTRVLCKNTSNATLSSTDVVADTSVSPYREAVTLQAIYGLTDNPGTTFYEFGLFNNSVFPTEVTSTNNPTAGSSVVINVPSTTGFSVSQKIMVNGTSGGNNVSEVCNIASIVGGTSITVTTLANTYSSHVVLTAPSGDMFNHFILGTSIAKTSSISVTVQCTVRF